MQKRFLFFLALLCTLYACKKEVLHEPEVPAPVTTPLVEGLSPSSQSINGYLYSSFKMTHLSSFSWNYATNFTGAAYFGEPARNLMINFNHLLDQQNFLSVNSNTANVSAGNVTINGMRIGGAGTTDYLNHTSPDTSSMNLTPKWEIGGNKTFVQAKVSLRPPPKILNTAVSFSLQISNGYTLELTKLISGYDSAGVYISNNNSVPIIYKSCPAGVSSIVFSSKELDVLKNLTTCNIMLIGFNYSHQVIHDKLYVFETSSKLVKYLTIKQ